MTWIWLSFCGIKLQFLILKHLCPWPTAKICSDRRADSHLSEGTKNERSNPSKSWYLKISFAIVESRNHFLLHWARRSRHVPALYRPVWDSALSKECKMCYRPYLLSRYEVATWRIPAFYIAERGDIQSEETQVMSTFHPVMEDSSWHYFTKLLKNVASHFKGIVAMCFRKEMTQHTVIKLFFSPCLNTHV